MSAAGQQGRLLVEQTPQRHAVKLLKVLHVRHVLRPELDALCREMEKLIDDRKDRKVCMDSSEAGYCMWVREDILMTVLKYPREWHID